MALEYFASLPNPPSAPEIQKKLSHDYPDLADRVPHEKTIQRRLRQLEVPQRGGWSVATADPDEAALVLPVIGARMRQIAAMEPPPEYRDWRDVTFSGGIEVDADVARWIARVRTIAPDMPLADAYQMALRYRRVELAGGATRHLDAYMALAPWRSEDEFAELQLRADQLLAHNWSSADLLPTEPNEEDLNARPR